MKKVFKDYICLNDKYFNQEQLNKDERKQRHNQLINWRNREYAENTTFEETLIFLRENTQIVYCKPFFDKLIIPELLKTVINEEYTQLKDVLNLFYGYNHYIQKYDYADYCITELANKLFETNKTAPSPTILLKRLFKRFPNDKSIMDKLADWLFKDFDFALHELPIGILHFSYETDIEDIKLLKELLRKLNKDLNDEDIKYVKLIETIYPAYNDYLLNIKEYLDFEDYLNKHSIDYN